MRALPTLLALLTLNLVLGLLLFRQQAALSPLPPPDPSLPRLVLLSELPGAPSEPALARTEPSPGEPVVIGIPDAVSPAPGTVISPIASPDAVATPSPAPSPAPTLTPPAPPPPVAAIAPRPETPPVVPVNDPPPPQRCLRLVGFGDQLAAQRAQRRLQDEVDDAKLHVRTVRNVRNYWVYLPSAANRPAALATSRQLGEKGLTDYFVTTSGTNPNAISLGVFSTRANAERRQAQVRSAGFPAEIAERAEETRVYDLDLRWRRTDALDWARALPDFRGLRAEALNCPTEG